MRCGSKPVSADGNATLSTFFCANAVPPASKAARHSVTARMRMGFKREFSAKPRNYIGWTKPSASMDFPRAPFQVDVRVLVGVVQERVLVPAEHPRLDQLVALAMRKKFPRRIDRDDARHLVEDLDALRARGRRRNLVVQLVELLQLEAAVIRRAAVGAVEQLVEVLAVGIVAGPGEVPTLQLPQLRLLAQVRPLRDLHFHADADS